MIPVHILRMHTMSACFPAFRACTVQAAFVTVPAAEGRSLREWLYWQVLNRCETSAA